MPLVGQLRHSKGFLFWDVGPILLTDAIDLTDFLA
jgi:hypothetical protein